MTGERIHPLTPIMRRRRRIDTRRRIVWMLLAIVTFMTVVAATLVAQFYREGIDWRSSYAIQDFLVCRLFEWFLGIWVFVVGCCVASFLNVVAYRVPAGLPITGYSFCPFCGVPIQPCDNVPVLGWILLGGRCRACKLRISLRYPVFELIGGLLMLSVYLSTVLGHGSNLPWQRPMDLPYGIPINLRFMDETVFYVAGLHAWLLLFLYAGALTHFGGGRLPLKMWILGGLMIVGGIAIRPEGCILPFGGREGATAFLFPFDRLRSQALLTSAVGGTIAMVLAWFWKVPSDRRGWIAACCLIGVTLGWAAAVWILAMSAIGCLIDQQQCRNRPLLSVRSPLCLLWLWVAIFLIFWKRLDSSLAAVGPGWRTIAMLSLAMVSIGLYRSIFSASANYSLRR